MLGTHSQQATSVIYVFLVMVFDFLQARFALHVRAFDSPSTTASRTKASYARPQLALFVIDPFFEWDIDIEHGCGV